jgi:diadenosine tetraphosphatase ApaH/serine/threonine PP2A family protein phosphatase
MRIVLMADIHANREAFEACLAHARAQSPDRFVYLGDYVNYGADPEWVVAELMRQSEAGAVVLLGNHDAAVGNRGSSMTSPAELALEWTRVQLGAAERGFLAGLPLTRQEEDRFFVHADPAAPSKWGYVTDVQQAGRGMRTTGGRITICGHVHKPAIYSLSPASKITAFRPVDGVPVPLLAQRRWLAVVGSVGQPRDGNPAAAYALLDTTAGDLTTFRVAYDVDAAADKIRAAGLPEMLAERLKWGA